MSVQKIPLETAQKIQRHLRSALTLPESENQPRSWSAYQDATDADEIPLPDSLGELGDLFSFGSPVQEATYAPNTQGQWFISSMNPAAALLKLPGLQLKPDLRWVAYLHRLGEEGTGITWAVPEHLSTTAHLEHALVNRTDRAQPPYPEGALDNVMESLEGDRSPLSFLIASLLRRELRELGAIGKSCRWSHHRLIGILPKPEICQWRIQPPQNLVPKACVWPDGRAAIEFFTCRTIAPIAIFQHIDQYSAETYKAAGVDRAIAVIQS